MQETFLGLQDDDINVQILRMKSTIKQENNRTLKRTGFSHLYVRTLVPGSATLPSESSVPLLLLRHCSTPTAFVDIFVVGTSKGVHLKCHEIISFILVIMVPIQLLFLTLGYIACLRFNFLFASDIRRKVFILFHGETCLMFFICNPKSEMRFHYSITFCLCQLPHI